jgi:hypothetical protein
MTKSKIIIGSSVLYWLFLFSIVLLNPKDIFQEVGWTFAFMLFAMLPATFLSLALLIWFEFKNWMCLKRVIIGIIIFLHIYTTTIILRDLLNL